MTALVIAEQWRDRFLELAEGAEDRADQDACLEAAALLEELRIALERLRQPC